jgi:hypothetical protein
MPAAIGCTRGCDDPQGSGAAVPLTAGQLWFVSGPGRLPLAKSAITGCRAEILPGRRRLTGDELAPDFDGGPDVLGAG